MKHLKTYGASKLNFEKESEVPPNYKVGDTVVCRYIEKNDYIEYGKKYIVNEIYLHDDDCYYVKLENVYDMDNKKLGSFYAGKFVPEYEWYANKYNL